MHPLTAAHRRQLLGLRANVLRELRLLWRTFDPADRRSWPRFVALATPLLQKHHGGAVALGSRYYGALRTAALGLGANPNEVTLPPIELSPEHVAASLAATGLAGTYSALRAGKTLAAALDNGYVRAGMSASRLVLSGSRTAVTKAAAGDARNRGWVRATGGKACSWCSARSGVVMTSAEVFQAHDGCSCAAQPVWT